jgi:hypothetical protein
MWGIVSTLFVLALEALFLFMTGNNFAVYGYAGVATGLLFAGGLFLLFRGLFTGLIDVILVPRRDIDLIIEENAAGILLGSERWYLFLDGIISIHQHHRGIWTIQHHNGSVLHIPAKEITDDQLAHLRAAMERGRTPEGVRAVIERGRRIAQLEQQAAAAAARHPNP